MQNSHKDNVRSSAVGKQLKRKKSNSLSLAQHHLPPLDLFWASFFVRVQLTSLLLISPGLRAVSLGGLYFKCSRLWGDSFAGGLYFKYSRLWGDSFAGGLTYTLNAHDYGVIVSLVAYILNAHGYGVIVSLVA